MQSMLLQVQDPRVREVSEGVFAAGRLLVLALICIGVFTVIGWVKKSAENRTETPTQRIGNQRVSLPPYATEATHGYEEKIRGALAFSDSLRMKKGDWVIAVRDIPFQSKQNNMYGTICRGTLLYVLKDAASATGGVRVRDTSNRDWGDIYPASVKLFKRQGMK